MLFNECSEQEQQKTPVHILSVDAFAERCGGLKRDEKSKYNLSYSLYYRMRVLQGCDDDYVYEEEGEECERCGLTDYEEDKQFKKRELWISNTDGKCRY